MERRHRRRHLILWVILLPLIAIGLALSLTNRPERPVSLSSLSSLAPLGAEAVKAGPIA